MNLLRYLIRPYLYARYGFHRITGSGAFRGNRARYVHSGVQPQWNSLKQAIWKFHVKQFHESACSVATVVSCINAIRSMGDRDIEPLSQSDILDRVTAGNWKARMSDGGYHGRRGLPLPLLGQVVRESIAAYGLRVNGVDTVQTPKYAAPESHIATSLKKHLRDFDRHGNGLVIIHFDQGALLPTLNIPHISPVGAYDPAADRVTVLDVDPDQKDPYQIDFKAFYRALASDYHHLLKPFGYGSGGYIHIRIR